MPAQVVGWNTSPSTAKSQTMETVACAPFSRPDTDVLGEYLLVVERDEDLRVCSAVRSGL